jgi:hypothetical protein
LGGLLHALNVPFTGMIVGGVAVILITLIGYYSQSRQALFKATMTVVLIKFLVSPHTPPNAYLAVFLEGLSGMIWIPSKKGLLFYTLFVGIFSLVYSAVQKFVVLTLLFGMNLWNALDKYVNYVREQLFHISEQSFSFSFWLILIYVIFHAVWGILIGLLAARIPSWIEREKQSGLFNEYVQEVKNARQEFEVKIKKRGFIKKHYLLILGMILVILSYFFPVKGFNQNIVYVFRALVFIVLWFRVLPPLVYAGIKRLSKTTKFGNQEKLSAIVALFPELKKMTQVSLAHARRANGLKKIKVFISVMLMLAVFQERNSE